VAPLRQIRAHDDEATITVYQAYSPEIAQPAVVADASRWVVGIDDITADVHAMHRQLRAGRDDLCRAQLPSERPYPLPAAISRRLGATI
jgi:hypothetical protein